MATPQQRELARDEKVPALSPDASETELSGHPDVDERGRTGPVPEDNLPGHHPDEEQDKPDGEAFLRKLQGEGRPEEVAAKKTKPKPKPKKAAARKTTAKKASAPVKKAGTAPIPAVADLPSGAAKTTRTPEATASPRATTTTSGAGGVDLRDLRDVALRLTFWPVTVGVWAGRQVLRRLQDR